jgi:hypothetical protein
LIGWIIGGIVVIGIIIGLLIRKKSNKKH